MTDNRICIVVPSLTVGGMERVAVEIANYIVRNTNYNVTIIKLTSNDKNFYHVSEKVTIVEPDFIFNRRLRVYHSFKILYFLIKTIRNSKPISVLSFGEMYNSFVLLSSFFSDSKYFVSDRSQPNKKWGFFHERMRKLIYRRAHGIVAQTSYSKDFFEKELNHKNIQVIPNPGRDVEHFQVSKENIVLYVGRLFSSKRVDLLIDIFTEINNPDWKLWIVGDGPEREKLEAKLAENKCRSQITIFGAQKNVHDFYSKAKLFAFTSLSEGFPNVLIEAQAHSLPCISFDCVAGPSDIIEDAQNGYLIPLMDTSMFQTKLAELMSNDDLTKKMAINALEASKKYQVNVIANQFLKFITS